MLLSYWDCKYRDYRDTYNEETSEEIRTYGCTHPSKYGLCDADNEYEDAVCPVAEMED